MKKKIFTSLVALLSLAVFAGQVPQEKLDRINAFITASLGDYAQMVTVEFKDAQTSEESGLLTSANLEANVMGFAKITAGLGLVGENVELKAALSGSAAQLDFSSSDLLEMAGEAEKFVDAINAKGIYKAAFTMKGSETGTNLSVTMKPAKEDPTLSVKTFEIKAFIPNDLQEGEVSVSLAGKFAAGAKNVAKAQKAFTGIFNSLANGQEPTEEDFTALGEVLAEVLRDLELS
ncbi:MAG: hypothetical protein HN509_05740 [Halobacteriovoraceae bacterium]|jgi:hypothetical protein|nr:hypothetical protein [Halobacteriovoraceae bacterium]MBT5095851.1 hypothetical protein [Halobacteriovoraceae bacterium]